MPWCSSGPEHFCLCQKLASRISEHIESPNDCLARSTGCCRGNSRSILACIDSLFVNIRRYRGTLALCMALVVGWAQEIAATSSATADISNDRSRICSLKRTHYACPPSKLMKARHSPEAAAAAAADAAALPGAAEAAAAAAAEADPPLLATEAAAEAAAALPANHTATDGCLFVEPSHTSSLHLLPWLKHHLYHAWQQTGADKLIEALIGKLVEVKLYQRMERLAQSLGCRLQMRQMHQKRRYLRYALGALHRVRQMQLQSPRQACCLPALYRASDILL